MKTKKVFLLATLAVVAGSAWLASGNLRRGDDLFRENLDVLADGEGVALLDPVWRVTVQYMIDPVTLETLPISFTCETGGEFPCKLIVG